MEVNPDITFARIKADRPGSFQNISRANLFRGFDFMALSEIEFKSISSNTLLFHGSSFFIKNNAYIFIGPSGTGKTTVIKKVEIKQRLSNDTVVIKRINGKFFAFSSAFDKKFVSFKSDKKVPVKKIYVLKQSKINTIKTLNVSSTLNHILRNDIYNIGGFGTFMSDKKTNRVVKSTFLKLILDLLSKVDIMELCFTKDFDLYSII